MPDFVHENGVHAARKDVDIEVLKDLKRGGDRRQFRRSDEGEVAGVET